VFSCQIAEHVREGQLEIVLADDEDAPIPVHVLTPTGRLSMPKARAFVDFAVPRLRSHFARLAKDAEETGTQSRCQNVMTPQGIMRERRSSSRENLVCRSCDASRVQRFVPA
jgi:hypothetical protein